MSEQTGVTTLYGSDVENASDPATADRKKQARFWQKEHEAERKRMRKFNKQGNAVVQRYLDERDGKNDSQYFEGYRGDTPSKLNLFYENTSTIESMLYGQTPKIEVSREHQDPDDDIARVASLLFQRMLDADALPSGSDISTVLRAALQDRLLPGLGTSRVRYTCQHETAQGLNPSTMEMEEYQKVVAEDCPVEYVHWQDFAWGWARTWKEVPWVGFRSWLTKEQIKERFGDEFTEELEYTNQLPSGTNLKDGTHEKDDRNNVQKAEIWEFWHKREKKVYWHHPGYDKILDVKDDPLQLDGFWPCPKPLMANLTTTLLKPRADFVLVQDLYNEIDELQSRIATITRAVKVVGVYDKAEINSVGRMFKEAVENDMIPVDNWAGFAEKGGLGGAVDWFPTGDVSQVLQVLNTVQQEKIQQLNELMGLGELMRGQSPNPYLGEGTNKMSVQMGSIKIQRLQDEFAQFASDLDALKCEVIGKHYDQGTIITQSNAMFVPEPDRPMVPQAIMLMQDPNVKWRVNIRPESISMVDYAQMKQERTEFLTAMATYLQSAQAAAQQIPGSIPMMIEMLKWGMAGFRGSDVLEGSLDQFLEMLKNNPMQDPGQKDQAQNQAEIQKLQMEHQMEMQRLTTKHQGDMQLLQVKMQGEMEKLARGHQSKLMEQQAKDAGDMRKIAADLQADLANIKAGMQADLAAEESQAVNAAAEAEVDHVHDMTEMEAQHEYNMIELGAEHETNMREKEKDAKMEADQGNRSEDGSE